jgi:hypothetical protein
MLPKAVAGVLTRNHYVDGCGENSSMGEMAQKKQ